MLMVGRKFRLRLLLRREYCNEYEVVCNIDKDKDCECDVDVLQGKVEE